MDSQRQVVMSGEAEREDAMNVMPGFLDQCEKEPLHLSGAIQSHGTLLVADWEGMVVHVAANIEAYLGRAPSELLGQQLPAGLARLVAILGAESGNRKTFRSQALSSNGLLDVVLWRGIDGHQVIELTTVGQQKLQQNPLESPFCIHIDDDNGLARQRQILIERVADITGFDRVLYYQFREDGDGEVRAEFCANGSLEHYMGLRFPAADIPQIARRLYIKNPWRMIADATADPIDIISVTTCVPDLTWSDLRSVSPVHRIYLGNMGVCALLSIPIVVADELDALITAHHHGPRTLPLATLEHLRLLVDRFAIVSRSYAAEKRLRTIDALERRFEEILPLICLKSGIALNWRQIAPWLLNEFHADGAMLWFGEHLYSAGITIEPEVVPILQDYFEAQGCLPFWLSDHLNQQIPGLPPSRIAGMLAITVKPEKSDRILLILNRREYVYEVDWGGNPYKIPESSEDLSNLTPRRSFAKWVETRRGFCSPWTKDEELLGRKLRTLLMQIESVEIID